MKRIFYTFLASLLLLSNFIVLVSASAFEQNITDSNIPRYSIETVEKEVSIPFSIPTYTLIADSFGYSYKFPQYTTNFVVTVKTDVNMSTGEIIRASISKYGINTSQGALFGANVYVSGLTLTNKDSCCTISSDKKHINLNLSFESDVRYRMFWQPGGIASPGSLPDWSPGIALADKTVTNYYQKVVTI